MKAANKINTGVNTPSTMNANENVSAAIIAELNTRNARSAWDKGVTEYATELAESLDNWDKQPESVAELREMLLNGADNRKAYSWGVNLDCRNSIYVCLRGCRRTHVTKPLHRLKKGS